MVNKNVEAYKTLYKAIKSFDPDLPVVATSVEPNEEYFQAGYGEYCDAFDFHIYESAERVRRTIGEYRELQKEYDVVKPIWSTELGLNSQGMTRLRVAGELHKKFATFFAAGGENVSWFGLFQCLIHQCSDASLVVRPSPCCPQTISRVPRKSFSSLTNVSESECT